MNRKISKILSGAFAIVGAVIVLVSLAMVLSGNDGVFGLLFGAIWFAAGGVGYRRLSQYEARDFAWYKATYANQCASNDRVSCKDCGSHQIRVRGLKQHTYTREHFCGRCGTTLYYSPEG